MKHEPESFVAIQEWLGIGIDASQRSALLRFEQWLEDEAVPAGGLGPREAARLFDRHIVDSLAFQVGIPAGTRNVVDVGGGVGLPSIPLAILRPDIHFVLVDRSLRRTDLASRAAKILELPNFAIDTNDISTIDRSFDVALFRASLPILGAAATLKTCLRPQGIALLGVSRQIDVPAIPNAPEGITFALSQEGDGILGSPFWLLRMWRN